MKKKNTYIIKLKRNVEKQDHSFSGTIALIICIKNWKIKLIIIDIALCYFRFWEKVALTNLVYYDVKMTSTKTKKH